MKNIDWVQVVKNSMKHLLGQNRDLRNLIIRSGLFDEAYYREHNPDVVRARIDPLDHFIEFGGFEGRIPSLDFNPAFYLAVHPEANAFNINPLVHYLKRRGSLENPSSLSYKNNNVLKPDYTCMLPRHFFIDPGNICNLRCPFCSTGAKGHKYQKGFLSLENFRIILDKIKPYAQLIEFYNWGEPFLNKDIYEMLSLASQNGIRTNICSNLSIPHLDHEALVRSGLTVLMASIDGACQETYGLYRKGGDFELVLQNIKEIQAVKKRLGSDKPDLIWSFLIHKFNEHEQKTARRLALDLGIRIHFDLMCVWDPAWMSTLHQKGEVYSHLKGTGTSEYTTASRSLPVSMDTLILHPSVPSFCKQVFSYMIIYWDGAVAPCCSVYENSFVLGNLLETDLQELWNNAGFRNCRQFLYNYGPPQDSTSVCASHNCPLARKYVN